MFKKFLLICVGIIALCTAKTLNGQTTPPRAVSTATKYNFVPGQDVTRLLQFQDMCTLFGHVAMKLGTDPTKIWDFYSRGNVQIHVGYKLGLYEVAIAYANSGGIVIYVEEQF